MRIQYLTVLLLLPLLGMCEAVRRRTSSHNCTAPPESGECRAAFRRWYHDPQDSTCKMFIWGGCGGNDNRFQSMSICERHCLGATQDTNVCPAVMCRKRCNFGYMLDDNNCTICACRPNPRHTPTTECPARECPDPCPSGHEVDAQGCSSCACRPSVRHRIVERAATTACPPVCRIGCQYGMKQDDSGCFVCECLTKAEACGEAQCAMHCEFGFKKDLKGCDLCECSQSGNKTYHRDRQHHRHEGERHHKGGRHHHGGGKHHGRRGENAAQLPAEGGEVPAQLPAATVSCPANRCKLNCQHGYVKDSFGCSKCRCSSAHHRPTGPGSSHRHPTGTKRPSFRATTVPPTA